MNQSKPYKVTRAREQLEEIEQVVEETPPYTYWLGRNLKTGESYTFTKRDEIALEKIAVRCGEIFHNLKSVLDHTYFKAVSPHVIESKHKSILFPFVKDSSHLEERMISTHANKVNDEFYETILELKPHGGDDGNVLLYLIHQINISDKHKKLIPFADLTSVSSEKMQSEVPDFPQGITVQSSNTHKQVVWYNSKYNFSKSGFKQSLPLTQRKLDIDIELLFDVKELQFHAPYIPLLNDMIEEVEAALKAMENSM